MPLDNADPRRLRGRHLLVLDVAACLGAALAATTLVHPAIDSLWAVPVLVGLPLLGLVSSGVYVHARPLADVASLTRVIGYVGAAAVAAGLLVLIVRPGGLPAPPVELIVLEELAALALMLVARAGLGAAGATRYAPADENVPYAIERPVPPQLERMLRALAEAPAVYRPSRFWESLGRRHLAYLGPAGEIGEFKRTLNTSYFQFGGVGLRRALPVLIADWLRHPDLSVLTARAEAPWPRWLATALALYANAVRARPFGHLLDRIAEPQLGRPIVVRYGGRALTEDLCHSVEEFGSIMSSLPAGMRLSRALELGAGYGRLAYVFAMARPDIQYHVVDIPPALYVSQRYLTTVLPNVPAFTFRTFTSYADVAEQMARAKIVFLEPQQLELLPDGYADLILTVSTLHEMRTDQVSHYLTLANRLCSGAFYSKQWRRFYNHLDEVTATRETYPIPAHWTKVFDRSPIVPRSFFEALYLCRGPAA
jgi:putative sugar O-methyltransferase